MSLSNDALWRPPPPQEAAPLMIGYLEAVREGTTHIEARYTEQLAAMAALRQSLLQAAFSGQLS